VASERLAIAQVTPFAWEVAHEVNDYVARVSGELSARGHRVLIIAPSESGALVRDSRRALRSQNGSLLERAEDEPLVLGVVEPRRVIADEMDLDCVDRVLQRNTQGSSCIGRDLLGTYQIGQRHTAVAGQDGAPALGGDCL